MTINKDKSSAFKKILKVGEDILVTHKGDSENPLLTSSTSLGAVDPPSIAQCAIKFWMQELRKCKSSNSPQKLALCSQLLHLSLKTCT
jgi:hypothetical protein